MAAPQPVSDKPEVAQQYVAQIALSAALAQAITSLWLATKPLGSPEAMRRFTTGLYALLPQFGAGARTLATDYYRNVRKAAGLADASKIKPVDLPPRPVVDAGLRWALRENAETSRTVRLEAARLLEQVPRGNAPDQMMIRSNAAAVVRPSPQETAAEIEAKILADIQAALQKAVEDVAREQIVQAVEGDDKAIGYRRVARPDACAWCLTLAIRTSTRKGLATDWVNGSGGSISRDAALSTPGADGDVHFGVYKSRAAAGQTPAGSDEVNRYHDHCHCIVEPIFSAADTPPQWVLDTKRFYEDATADSGKGEHLNDFRRALYAKRHGKEPAPPKAPVGPLPATPPAAQVNDLLDRLDAAMATHRPAA